MKELYGSKVEFEEAKILADLTSIFQDLKFTIETLKRLIKLLKDKSEDRILVESLWTTALISYARCFSTGKRFGLKEDIFKNKDLKGDPIGCHNYYINLRNKHVAHSVNPFEQIAVDLQLSNPDDKERKVLGVSVLSQKLICSTLEGVEDLIRLAIIAFKDVGEQCKGYEKKVLEIGKKLPLNELYSKARSRIITPGSKDAERARE